MTNQDLQVVEKIPPELLEVVEGVGESMEYWGFKKVHGQIWTYLYLSERPLEAADFIGRLNISKALVSLTLAELKKYEVIEEVGKGPHGVQYYRASSNVARAILNVLRARERPLVAKIGASHRMLKKLDKDALKKSGLDPKRIKSLENLIRGGEAILDCFINLSFSKLKLQQFFEGTSK